MSTHIIDRLDQARLLTDPFKLKLLENFADQPRTTKQVADLLGEKAPRLYRHVDALFRAGLIELVEERPKRGTIERYYRSIATRFEMAPEMFTAGTEESNEAASLVLSLVRETTSDLTRLMEEGHDCLPDVERAPLILKVSLTASRAEVKLLRKTLLEWVAECERLADLPANAEGEDDRSVSVAGLVAFYET